MSSAVSWTGSEVGAEGTSAPTVLVLGIGNLLLKDDGVGVHAIRRLAERELPPNVTLLEAGTAGHQLLGDFAEFDRLLVIDSVEADSEPGAIFRFTPEDVPNSRTSVTSLHQMSLLEILDMARLLGRRPETVIIGVQARDVSPWGDRLTPEVEAKLPEVVELALKELRDWGAPAPVAPCTS